MYHVFNKGLSLKTQIYGLIIAICILSFVVRIVSDIDTTRDYLQKQLASHAQDTATSLGLSISPYLKEDSLVLSKTMATAIFDSGYYRQIRFIDHNNSVLFSLENPSYVESVPQWFVNYIKLTAPTMYSEINSGWIIAGTLEVTSHLGEAYTTLWRHAKESFYSSFLVLIISLAIAYLILQAVFKPLKAVERQALLVTRKRFTVNNTLPLTRELRVVTQAINNMVANLKTSFNTLTKQTQALSNTVYSDSLTGLGNRKLFENYFNTVIHSVSPVRPFTGIMITLPSLQHINQSQGYQIGDDYVIEAVQITKHALTQLSNYKLCRLNGSTLIILAPYESNFLQLFQNALSNTFKQHESSLHINGYANIALVSINKETALSGLLSALDTRCTINKMSSSSDQNNQSHFSVQKWREIINLIINSGDISYSLQPIKQANSQQVASYFEVFGYFINEGKLINNSHLFAMAERLELTIELDKKLIANFIAIKAQYPKERFALNISKASLYSSTFINWLNLLTKAHPILKSNLVFEFHELSLLADVKLASRHIDIIKKMGIGICIEHFGTSLTSFKYLQDLDIEYVKIDGGYVQDLLNSAQSQFYIQAVINICHGVGIKVFASIVETADTLTLLEELGCDALQGNLICPPYKINIIDKNTTKKFTFHPNVLKFCNKAIF
jgi:EAL domain-containing protein (putative c-di-GMP-specific phosphodiesterase class I)/GGDEF domain-containing protein